MKLRSEAVRITAYQSKASPDPQASLPIPNLAPLAEIVLSPQSELPVLKKLLLDDMLVRWYPLLNFADASLYRIMKILSEMRKIKNLMNFLRTYKK
ncbi:hypothetical protein [Chryseobacterium binzhouense]|uniref:hypothetical protein n=1 Tax=Chryseobacterium binzhouense TaxID=2593646 RepID=UPI00117C0A97|nr:hypothetical protein [Chryseobacterium binzhouense]